MEKRRLLTALALTTVLAGCATPYSEAPLATKFPTSKQSKLQAVAHWNVIANDVAKQLASMLKAKPALPVLYVNQVPNKTDFDRVFSNQLISALLAEGFSIQKSPVGALVVDIDTQAVRFSANRPQYRYAGAATTLTAGVWALHGATPAGIATAAIVGADAYMWFSSEFATGATPRMEIVITASVSDSRQYLARNSSVYYVADADGDLYQYQGPAPVRTLNIIGG